MNQCSLILLRGLPGSGKTTLAKVLSEGGKYPILSIDTYFTNPDTGEYVFDFEKNHLAYAQCEAQTREKLAQHCKKVFVDNTFTIEWELTPYFKMAAEFNYTLFVVTVENRHGSHNVHNIPQEQLVKMAAKYKVQLFAE